MDQNEIVQIITTAARNMHTLIIDYTKSTTGEAVTHEVEPYEIKGGAFWGRRVDLEGSKGTRRFFLENISNISETENTFTPMWEVKF